jgi:rhamnopyranosyl-N-acetylglucosaminyl-diphospho-decaprenol beta-1,3/1,4-galactofuranosyltransferase
MGGHVCAIVVTHNRPALLRACLLALRGQTRPADAVLVVDNASTDETRAMVRAEFPEATTLALAANVGGAGGFHAGMRWAYGQGYEWLWLMDDDARPAPDCLARLLAHARPASVVVPLQQDSGGGLYGIGAWGRADPEVTNEILVGDGPVAGPYVFRFVGPLVARGVVVAVGLPNKDFFIWFDDIEYSLRVLGRPELTVIVVPDAIVHHDFGQGAKQVRVLGRTSIRMQHPAWKMYYGERNRFYTLVWTRRNPREVFQHVLFQLRWLIGDIIYEPDRWERARLRLLGLRDGAIGRLGKRL